ncbi:hemerythrin domain-containing protein [Ornithinimicrobium ciconiae]|uniref:Hemerythrin domain-containing protein n=1 Tax=Ornithinimicrobium ciconiae TaxID=2594265 RepID=A0A516G9T6_9MICO|nr:hemerythrin domain-containing protein [Ornithinimicrobium ciconiae]QDO88287.1 hemerythrin domain-containing protein [Ornithinimicrobium ciconiae]
MENTLTEALEREHDEIDAGLEAFGEGLDAGNFREDELTRAAQALRRHIYLEETFLFPPLRAAGMLPPVLVMLREHGEIWRTLDALEDEVAILKASSAASSGTETVTKTGTETGTETGTVAGSSTGEGVGTDTGAHPLPGSGAAADHCHDLLEILAEHNAKEEPIIYPQGDIVLAPDVKADLHDWILEGTMPQGWVCEQA